jgi:hypothetical protein
MDALQQLISCYQQGHTCSIDPSTTPDGKSNIIINGVKFPFGTRTPLINKLKSTATKKEYYGIEQVYLVAENFGKITTADLGLKATNNNIVLVNFQDMRPIYDYVHGKSTPKFLDTEFIPDTQILAEDVIKNENNWTIDDVRDNEIPLSSRSSILKARGSDLSFLCAKYDHMFSAEAVKEAKSASASKSSNQPSVGDKRSSSTSNSAAAQPNKKGKVDDVRTSKYANVPIIVVPNSLTFLINIFNAKEFLSGGVFVPVRGEVMNTTKPAFVSFERQSLKDPTRNATFHVIDDVTKVDVRDFERIVAIFVTGQKWQFTAFKERWNKSIAEVFASAKSFHMHYDDEKLSENVNEMFPHVLKISKNKRYLDKSIAVNFWTVLSQWISAQGAKKEHINV